MPSTQICKFRVKLTDKTISKNEAISMQQYLKSTSYFDHQSPEIKFFADEVLGRGDYSDKEIAVLLYYAVRDGSAYNPYVFSIEANSMAGTYCLASAESYCIPKAVLLGTLARHKGIPARLGLADVKNHISSIQLTNFLRTNVFVMHGYIELFLEGQWVKATPAFDAKLCEKIGVATLEFDGTNDSVFQQYNLDGNQEIEYVADHGTFDDVPLNFILESIAKAYPHLASPEVMDELHHQSLASDLDVEG